MSTLITRSTLVASALATVLIGAVAQTSTPTPTPAAPPATTSTTTTTTTPATVGVSPATAATATEKAVPRSDVGTAVQTGPSVSDRMAPNTGTPADASMSTSTTMPPPKTDRN